MSQQLSLLDLERLQRPGSPDDQLVASIAARTIEELAEEPPVSLEVVASYRSIADIRQEELESAGSLTSEETGLVMRLRRGDSRRRQRFTGFHEVAHTFQAGFREQTVFRCAPTYRRSDQALDPEVLSDVGAAELLLPARHFSEDIETAEFGFSAICELADRYDASIQATAYRFSAFWPEPTLVMVLEPGLRKAEVGDPSVEARLRVRSVWAGSGEWPWIPKNKSAATDSPLNQALRSLGAVDTTADLSEVAAWTPSELEVSAQAFRYRNANGNDIQRVLAIYRQRQPAPARRA